MQLYQHQQSTINTCLPILANRQGAWDLSATRSGKTAPALNIIDSLLGSSNHYALMLVTKTSLLNMEREWQQWFPNRNVIRFSGTPARRKKLEAQITGGTVVLCVHETAARTEFFHTHNPLIVAVDEAHRLRNTTTQLYAGLNKITPVYRYLMTATPEDWNPEDMYGLLAWLDPQRFRPLKRGEGTQDVWSRNKFISEFTRHAQRKQRVWDKALGRYKMLDIFEYIGPKNVDRLQEIMRQYGVRHERTMAPPVVENKVLLEFGEQQRRHYDGLRRFNALRKADGTVLMTTSVMAQLTRLMQVADNPAIIGGHDDSPKDGFICDLLESQRPIAVFSRFAQAMQLLGQRIRDRGYRVGYITGEQSSRQRYDTYTKLNAGELDVALCVYGAAGEAIDLQVPEIVAYDLPWSYIQYYQAMSRFLGPNNKREYVTLTYLIMEGSVDEYVKRVLDTKTDVNGEVVLSMMLDEGAIK